MKLLEPYNLTPQVRLKNRIVLPALVTRLATEEGYPTQELKERYVRYALGGVGLIVTEATAVLTRKSGPFLRISEDCYVEPLRDVVKAVHEVPGAKIIPQLIHFLKISRSGYRQKVQDLTKEDMQQVVADFTHATVRAREAGFDGVEFHMAHAYTLASSLSTRNRRRDEYGKTLEGRLRLSCQSYEAARKAVGDDYLIGTRINGDEFIKKGNTLLHSTQIAVRLASLGINYISVSAGGKFEDAIPKAGHPLDPYTGYSGERCMPPDYMTDMCNVFLAEAVRKAVREAGYSTPIFTAGKISSAGMAESILQEGKADLIALGRPLLCDPDWPLKVAAGREKDILPCNYCNVCIRLDMAFRKVICEEWEKGWVNVPRVV